MTKKQEEESACERVPDESEGKPDQEQELVEALSEIGKTAQEATDSWDQFHRVWEQAIEAVAKKLAEKFAKIEREETNNWRKLHGKPMRRRGGWHGRI